MAYEVIDGKIAMDFIKPVSIQWMWICRALGETAFRLIMLTAPTFSRRRAPISRASSGVVAQISRLFVVAVVGSILLMAAINFMIGTCAIPLTSILALIRAKYWLIELLSGLLIPMTYFPAALQKSRRMAALRAHRFHAAADLSWQAERCRSRESAGCAVAMDCSAALAWKPLVAQRHAQNHDSRRVTIWDAYSGTHTHARTSGTHTIHARLMPPPGRLLRSIFESPRQLPR